MKTNPLCVASVQFQHRPGDKQANLDKMLSFVQAAAERSMQLVCFPECCVTGYWHLRNLTRSELNGLAESIPNGPTTKTLLAWAEEYRTTIGAGLIEIDDSGQLFNAYVVVSPNGQVRCHRKLHCFISSHMQSGDQFTVFDLPNGWRVGVLICYDNNIVENVRISALLGAELIIAPHQTGGCDSRSPHAMGLIDVDAWENRDEDPERIQSEILGEKGRGWLMRWLPSRAHDNGVFYLFSNGIGRDDDEVRTGNAMILDPYGRILVESRKAADDMVFAELDAQLREHCTGVRWMRARRPELYQPIVQHQGIEKDTRSVRFGDP